MTLGKRNLALLMLAVGALLVTGTTPRSTAQARGADQSSAPDAAETTQAKIARALSGPS